MSTPPARTMAERTRSSIDVESLEAFNTGNPSLTDGSLIGLLSNLPVPPFEVDHHRSSCCLPSFNQSMRAMLTLVFMFMLFNLTSIWNLPTISTGVRGHDGVSSLVHPDARFFVHGRARKEDPRGIPRWRQPPRFHAMLRRSVR